MKRIKSIFLNLLSLSATSLLLRMIGLSFQIYLSKTIGPAAVGLLQLVMAIYFLAATFAVSGVRLATTRLVAEELSVGREAGAKQAVKCCLAYCLTFSTASGALLYLGASFIAKACLGDTRAILALRILALGLPFLACSTVLGGYFTAVRRVLKLSLAMIVEQVTRVGTTVVLIHFFLSQRLDYVCAGVALGICLGEILSCLLLFILYHLDVRKYSYRATSNNLRRRMLRIALPVALGAYVTSTMRTLQETLIPHGLKKSGSSGEKALATYGTIQGMAMPLLMFPTIFLFGLTDLIIPELAECQARGHLNRLGYIVNRVMYWGLLAAIGLGSIYFRFSCSLGDTFYNNDSAGHYLKILAPLVPVLYMDLLTDGMLKGIGQQLPSMGYNIIESMVGMILISLLLPRLGIAGYIFTLLFTRTLNFVLSLNRLHKITPLSTPFKAIAKLIFCVFNALILANFIIYGFDITWLALQISVVMAAYYLLLRLMSCISDEDLAWFKSIFR